MSLLYFMSFLKVNYSHKISVFVLALAPLGSTATLDTNKLVAQSRYYH